MFVKPSTEEKRVTYESVNVFSDKTNFMFFLIIFVVSNNDLFISIVCLLTL